MADEPTRESLLHKISDLEFHLRRERLENRDRIKEILQQVLEVNDGLTRLLEVAEKQAWPSEVKDFVTQRFALVGKKLLQVLFRAGAVQFDSLGQAVNYEYHEVTGEEEHHEAQAGHIVKVLSDGYALEGDVLRMAKVIVAKSSTE